MPVLGTQMTAAKDARAAISGSSGTISSDRTTAGRDVRARMRNPLSTPTRCTQDPDGTRTFMQSVVEFVK
jgi:hypothetical protein